MTKDQILKFISEIKPYEFIIGICRYTEITLVREDSCFPYVAQMTPIDMMDYARPIPEYSRHRDDASWYEDKHIEFEGQHFIIDLELTDIKYEDEYIVITRNSCYEPCIVYIPYEEICFVKKYTRYNGQMNEIYNYNKFQWELNNKKHGRK